MTSYTTLLEFSVPTSQLIDTEAVQQIVTQCLRAYQLSEAHSLSTELGEGRGIVVMYVRQDGSHATLRVYPHGLLLLDIQEFVETGADQVFSSQVIGKLEFNMKEVLKTTRSSSLPAVKRGAAFNRYFATSDNRLIEYDFDEVVYEADSPYQNVKIYHSLQFGNMLWLDNEQNLAESDHIYTRTIIGNGQETYSDKTVVILGGGDGGILHELLKESPKLVVMVDIDRLVIEAARRHLRGICGDSMDQLKGDNYEVLIDDCVPVLQQFVKEGRQFDYVINDLTDVPVSTEPVGDNWDLERRILDLSMKVLGPTGKYFTQGNGANMTLALATYERQLTRLQTPVEFRKEVVYIPSYHEFWVFYEIWKKPHQFEKEAQSGRFYIA